MANEFTRNIKNVRDINKQGLNTNNQNDMLSDDTSVYVRNLKKYEPITGNIQSVSYNQKENTLSFVKSDGDVLPVVLPNDVLSIVMDTTNDLVIGFNDGTSKKIELSKNYATVADVVNLTDSQNITGKKTFTAIEKVGDTSGLIDISTDKTSPFGVAYTTKLGINYITIALEINKALAIDEKYTVGTFNKNKPKSFSKIGFFTTSESSGTYSLIPVYIICDVSGNIIISPIKEVPFGAQIRELLNVPVSN